MRFSKVQFSKVQCQFSKTGTTFAFDYRPLTSLTKFSYCSPSEREEGTDLYRQRSGRGCLPSAMVLEGILTSMLFHRLLQECLQPCSPLGNILQTAEKLPLYNLEGNFISVLFVIKASMLIYCVIVIGYFTFANGLQYPCWAYLLSF